MRKKSVVTGFDKSLGQNMQEKASDELESWQTKGLRNSVITVVPIGEGHCFGNGIDPTNSFVVDRHSVGVASQIKEQWGWI